MLEGYLVGKMKGDTAEVVGGNARVHIRDVPFAIVDYDAVLNLFDDWVTQRVPRQVCIANVHTLMTAFDDPAYLTIYRKADLITMDGQPLRWYANLVHKAGIPERVCGPELMERCLARGVAVGWKHFFLGGRPDVLDQLVNNMGSRYPGVAVAGAYSPPFRRLSPQEHEDVIRRIREANPDFLWVGLGAPKQEQWIYDNREATGVPVQVGVGAAFDFHAGSIRRAPAWMQGMGLEWVYRLWTDPRLWRRYASTNPRFLVLLIKDVLLSRAGRLR